VVAGGEIKARRRAVDLLSRNGFRASSAPSLPLPDGTLLVVLTTGTEAERLHAIRELADAHGACPVIAVVPADSGNPSLRRALLAGAAGIVLDTEITRVLVPTARAVTAGQLTVPPSLGKQIAPRPLSHREKQILGLVMRGLTNREIARELFLAESTVKTHLSAAFRKIDARSRAEAVARIQDPESGYGAGILAIAQSAGASAA